MKKTASKRIADWVWFYFIIETIQGSIVQMSHELITLINCKAQMLSEVGEGKVFDNHIKLLTNEIRDTLSCNVHMLHKWNERTVGVDPVDTA